MTNPDFGVLANVVAVHANGPNKDQVITTFVDEKTDTIETRTYAELYENASRIARFLIDTGMQKGDRFAALLQNHPETVEALLAASISGTVIVPIDPRTRGDKLAYMLNDSSCRGVVCADYNVAEVSAVTANTALEWGIVLGEGGVEGVATSRSAADVLAEPCEAIDVSTTSGLDAVQVLYTSGTTGDPKGIVKPNLSLTLGTALADVCGLTQSDVLYTGLSLTHGNAQGFTLMPSLCVGIPSVFSRRFTKSGLWSTVRRFGCTVFTLLGGMTVAIYAEPESDDDADNPVRMIISAGMPKVIWRQFEKRFDLKLFEVYGAAEGGLFWNDSSGPAGSFGHLTSNPLFEGRVVDEDDKDVAPGEQGELIWRNRDGSPVVVQYLNNPTASEEKTRDGWFRTGDIVHRDADDWLFFDFRAGGGIRHNGDFVNPGFVEKALAEIDGVDDVFVYGVAEANMAPGEKNVVAAIVPAGDGSFDPYATFRLCREKLEANFVPSYLQVVDEIPKTASEKPQERFLQDMFAPDADGVYAR